MQVRRLFCTTLVLDALILKMLNRITASKVSHANRVEESTKGKNFHLYIK